MKLRGLVLVVGGVLFGLLGYEAIAILFFLMLVIDTGFAGVESAIDRQTEFFQRDAMGEYDVDDYLA
jgi:hypothetical protein